MKMNFITKSGQTVVIDIDVDDYIATVTTQSGKPIGKIEFRLIGGASARDDDYLKITWAYLDQQNGAYLNQGIGTECVRRMRDETGLSICTAENDGHKKEDGSHLTGDAPAFVDGLRKQGLTFFC